MRARGDVARVMRDRSGWLATAGGIGLIPWAPGTFGSLLAVFLWLPMVALGWPLQLGVIVLTLFLSGWSAGRAEQISGAHDPGWIVIDEVVGQWITLLVLTQLSLLAGIGVGVDDLQHLAFGFLCFRIFDIWKPWPISWVDRNVSGGWGTTWDDVLAGLFAAPVALALEWALDKAAVATGNF